MFNAAVDAVEQKLGRRVRAECVQELGAWSNYYNGGSEWASWPCYLSFVRDVVGWSDATHKNYAYYEDAAIHGGPRHMHREFVLLSERAAERHLDDRGRLHCENGPAIVWHCGTQRYFLRGVLVDEQIIYSPAAQTVGQINQEENEEVKRLRIERFAGDGDSANGWKRYLRETGAAVVDQRRNDVECTREALMRTSEGLTILVCACPSTARVYAIEVSGAVQTCAQAQEFLWSGSRTAGLLNNRLNIVGRS